MIESLIRTAGQLVPVLVTLLVVILVLASSNRLLGRRWRDNPDAQFRFQMIMLALTFAGVLAVIMALPIGDNLRGQLLGLIGILLSAAIALSATTFIGNIMAGIMLKAIKSARPGDFITVANLTGRITEMDLLHTEIQTEFRNLVTVPNLYMVTQPVEVTRSSGTIISAEVSLGYDVQRTDVAKILIEAGKESGLSDPFVHVRELGDYSVVYRVAGLLEDVKSLISARSRLREAMLDALHRAGIEIVSPTFMNQRVLSEDRAFIPKPSALKLESGADTKAEEIAFDKADEAASLEEIKAKIARIDAELAELADGQAAEDEQRAGRLNKQKAWLLERVKSETARQKAAELEEH